MFQDVRYAIRSAFRKPALTSVIVISLALGIGANTTIFTLINAVFLRPLPLKDPARLAQVFTVMPKSSAYQSLSLANYRDFRDNVTEFSGLVAYQGIGANLVGGTEPVATGGQLITGNYFQVLGVDAALGRTITPEEDKTLGASPVMVISTGLWNRAFASDPQIVGKTVTLNGFPFTVVGIMPAEFKGLQTLGNVDFWAPLAMHEQLVTGETARNFYIARNALAFQVVGRLQPGVTLERARQAMKAMAKRLEEQYPTENEGRSVELFPLTEAALGVGGRDNLVRSGGLLLAATGLVLLIACANVASLLLARAMERRKEIAVRLSVGAPRWRLIRQLLAESGVLAVMGGSAGILVAVFGRDLLWSFRPTGMRDDFLDLSLEPRVLWFTVALALVTGILFGLIPAIQGSRLDLLSAGDQESEGGAFSRWPLDIGTRHARRARNVSSGCVAPRAHRCWTVPAQPSRSAKVESRIPHRGPGGDVRQRRRAGILTSARRAVLPRDAGSRASAAWCSICFVGRSGSAVQRPGRFAPDISGGSRSASGTAQPLRSVQRHLARLLCDGRYPDSQGP
jgi:predicted permease